MNWRTLEHSKVAYLSGFGVYLSSCLVLAVVLIVFCPPGLRLHSIVLVISGALGWTLIEYLLHRFVLHGLLPFSSWHQLHHQRPGALIGVPVSIGALLTLVFVFLPAALVLDHWRSAGLTLGFLSGYLFYAAIHHVLHHKSDGELPWFTEQRHFHARHHAGLRPPGNYGVTTSIWDRLLGTVAEQAPMVRNEHAGLPHSGDSR